MYVKRKKLPDQMSKKN